ncbi:hypothetical protein D3C81_967920 [compost metagenome]
MYGRAPNNGLGLPLVGILKDVCRFGGSTLSTVGVVRVPKTPLGRAMAPWLAGGNVSKASNAALGSAGGLVNAEGSVGGGGPKSSNGAALTEARLVESTITETAPGVRNKLSELNPSVASFIFVPFRHAQKANPQPQSGRQLRRYRDHGKSWAKCKRMKKITTYQ